MKGEQKMTKSYEEGIAQICGIEASILFMHIKYWIERNRAEGKCFCEGRTWMYKTLAEFNKLFPYMSVKVISTALKKLIDNGFLIKDNFNKTRYDRTLWYALTDKAVAFGKKQDTENDGKAQDEPFCQKAKRNARKSTKQVDEKKTASGENASPIPSKEESKEKVKYNNNNYRVVVDKDNTQSCNPFSEDAREVLALLGKMREPSRRELTLYEKWREEYHISHDVILAACDMTGGASEPSFSYLSRIIDALHNEGICDIKEFESYKSKNEKHEMFCKDLFARMGESRIPSLAQRMRVKQFTDEYHIISDILNLAADRARHYSRPYEYFCKAATSLYESDVINNISDARDFLDRDSKTKAYSPCAHDGYARHNYTAEDLARIGVNLDDDEE